MRDEFEVYYLKKCRLRILFYSILAYILASFFLSRNINSTAYKLRKEIDENLAYKICCKQAFYSKKWIENKLRL